MKLVYAGNWFALGACIYGQKSPDEALRELGLRKPHKGRLGRTDIDVNELIRLRNEGLTIRAIAAKCGASFCAVRKRLLNAGIELTRLNNKEKTQ
nr:MAG TPA: GcrA cell cycle regulator [Caudoviricetes sp.]